MGGCGYRSIHPAEDFIFEILKIHKLNTKNINDLQTDVLHSFKDGSINLNEGIAHLKTLFEQEKPKNYYFNYHNRIFTSLIETVFSLRKEESSDKISALYLIFITFPFCRKVDTDNEKQAKIIRIQQFFDLVKKIEGKVAIGFRTFKEYLRLYLNLMTTVISKAVLEEAINSNEKPSVQDELKNLIERVYDEKNLEDYLTSITRDYEMKYATRIDTSEITLENLKELFDKRIGFFYIQDLRYEIVNNYAL
jgi:hypothetical protein